MIDKFELENTQLSKLLSLDKSAKDTLLIFIHEFDRTLKGQLDRSQYDNAKKQLVKRGITNLIKYDILRKIPSKQGHFMLNPYIFGSLFSHFIKQEWDNLIIQTNKTTLVFTKLPESDNIDNSTKNVPCGNKPLPNIFNKESLKRALDKCARKAVKKLTIEEKKEIQKIKLEQAINSMRVKYQSRESININDGLEALHLMIEELKITILQHAEGPFITGEYDDSLPRYKFSPLISKFEKDDDKSFEEMRIHGKLQSFSKKNQGILYKLHYLQTIKHSQYCVDLMQEQKSSVPCCNCFQDAYNELDSCLNDHTWFINDEKRNKEFQDWVKDWFKLNYPEMLV